ncbi:hypothetical protein VTK56DRAFT_1864 [Thermocarpiscus australiensis]
MRGNVPRRLAALVHWVQNNFLSCLRLVAWPRRQSRPSSRVKQLTVLSSRLLLFMVLIPNFESPYPVNVSLAMSTAIQVLLAPQFSRPGKPLFPLRTSQKRTASLLASSTRTIRVDGIQHIAFRPARIAATTRSQTKKDTVQYL